MVQVGEAWMPILCSTECARTSLRCAERAVGIDQEFRHEKQRNALGAGRRIGQPRQHEVDDIVGEIVLAVGDENLLALDAIAAVGRALGLGAQRADIGAGLRLGQLHRAGPCAGDEFFEIKFFQARRCRARTSASNAAMVSTGPMMKAIEAAFHISLQAALIESGRSWPPHSAGPDKPFQPAPAQAR